LLENDKYRFDNVYSVIPDYELEDMTEQELAEIEYEFKTHLFEDLVFDVRDIFRRNGG